MGERREGARAQENGWRKEGAGVERREQQVAKQLSTSCQCQATIRGERSGETETEREAFQISPPPTPKEEEKMGVITSKSRSTSSSQSNSKMGICIGRRLFKGSGLEVSPLGMGEAKSSSASSSSSSVLVVTQGDGAKKKEKATFLSVPTLVCPREGRDNETICTQETKSICLSMDTTREDNVEEKNFERPGLQVQKRDW